MVQVQEECPLFFVDGEKVPQGEDQQAEALFNGMLAATDSWRAAGGGLDRPGDPKGGGGGREARLLGEANGAANRACPACKKPEACQSTAMNGGSEAAHAMTVAGAGSAAAAVAGVVTVEEMAVEEVTAGVAAGPRQLNPWDSYYDMSAEASQGKPDLGNSPAAPLVLAAAPLLQK